MTKYFYTYKTTHPSGKYYVGRHTTNKIDDNYFGSGKWVRSIKDKSELHSEILAFYETFEDLLEAEQKLIDENLNLPDCMNFNNSTCGFASGDLNPACTEEGRQRLSKRVMGDLNPMKNPEVSQKVSIANKKYGKEHPRFGHKMSDAAKRKMSIKRSEFRYTEEQKAEISKQRKLDYASGKRIPHNKSGWTHSEESKLKQSELSKNRRKVECVHCGKTMTYPLFVRWHSKCGLQTQLFASENKRADKVAPDNVIRCELE